MNIAHQRKLLGVMGFRQWAWFTLRLDAARDWLLQIWYCHHNARVLADMEYRLGCVLSMTTRGMSKAYYSWDAMRAEIAAYQSDIYDEAIEDHKKDYDCHCGEK